MNFTPKRWTGLGLSAVLLASCGDSDQAADTAPADDTPQAVADGADRPETTRPDEFGEAGEGEGGAGEGGEGGIDIAMAASDPVVFLAGLAVVEAHVIAARDAFATGRVEAAAEMFAHPVSEVLVDMEPVLAQQGVEPFEELLIEASVQALDGATPEAVADSATTILAALNAAAAKAPDNGTGEGAIQARVAADQIERAIQQYQSAAGSEAYEPYLDGYGFYMTAAAIVERSGPLIEADNARAAAAIVGALDLLAKAYPGADRPARLDADQSALLAAGSRVLLALSN